MILITFIIIFITFYIYKNKIQGKMKQQKNKASTYIVNTFFTNGVTEHLKLVCIDSDYIF